MIPFLSTLFHHLMSRRAGSLARRLSPHLPPGASLLDIGSGTGHNAVALRAATGSPCLEADTVDFHVVGPGPIRFDGVRLPLGDGAVDVCLIAFVLNYAADPVALLREAGRVAARRVILVHSTGSGRWSRAALVGRNWWQGWFAFQLARGLGLIPPVRLPRQPNRFFQRERVEEIIARAGLIPTHFEPEPGFAAISRDLWIADSPASAPEAPSGPVPPLVSVIIPTRNEAVLIGPTVASVLRAAADLRVGVEILVIDNASTDGTRRALSQFAARPEVRVAPCEALGAARARNRGADLALGRILVFLDADTQLPHHALRRFVQNVEIHGFEAGMTRLGALDGGIRARCWWGFWNLVRCLPLARAKAMPACMFCTRAAFAEFGPFDARVAIGEEWPILAGLYRKRPQRLIYDWTLTALSSSRRMELQRFGYTRTFARYVWAILSPRGRVGYPDHIRHPPAAQPHPPGVKCDPGVMTR